MCPFDPRKEQDPQRAGVEMEPSIREKHGSDGWDRKRERENATAMHVPRLQIMVT